LSCPAIGVQVFISAQSNLIELNKKNRFARMNRFESKNFTWIGPLYWVRCDRCGDCCSD